jgi:hypothetical protein
MLHKILCKVEHPNCPDFVLWCSNMLKIQLHSMLRASPPRGGNRGCKPNFHPARQNLCPTGGCKSGARLIASVKNINLSVF